MEKNIYMYIYIKTENLYDRTFTITKFIYAPQKTSSTMLENNERTKCT